MEVATSKLIADSQIKAMSYTAYRELVAELAAEGRSTGPEQSEALTNYTQLNNRRMKRWDKTLKFDDATVAAIKSIDRKIEWLVLTESWCGDASPSLPVLHKISELNPNISLQIILRDEHIDLMNLFLTNGALSIPKLIAIDKDSRELMGSWGPRSEAATKLVVDYKTAHGKLTPEFKQDLQVWYNKDKGQSVLGDILKMLEI